MSLRLATHIERIWILCPILLDAITGTTRRVLPLLVMVAEGCRIHCSTRRQNIAVKRSTSGSTCDSFS